MFFTYITRGGNDNEGDKTLSLFELNFLIY